MRAAMIGIAVVLPVLPASVDLAEAQQPRRPWCLRTGGDGPTGGLNACSFYSEAQCRASIGGGGDSCFPNPDIGWDRIEGRRTTPPRQRGF